MFLGKKIWFEIENLRSKKFEILNRKRVLYEAMIPEDLKVVSFIVK